MTSVFSEVRQSNDYLILWVPIGQNMLVHQSDRNLFQSIGAFLKGGTNFKDPDELYIYVRAQRYGETTKQAREYLESLKLNYVA